MVTIIETERLILRTWKKEDADAYFQINQDPRVIELTYAHIFQEEGSALVPTVLYGNA